MLKVFLIQIKGINETTFSRPLLVSRATLSIDHESTNSFSSISANPVVYNISIKFFPWPGYYGALKTKVESLQYERGAVVRLIAIFNGVGNNSIMDIHDSVITCLSDEGVEVLSPNVRLKKLLGKLVKKIHGGSEIKRRPY